MNRNIDQLISVLNQSIGCKLERVYGGVHLFEGKVNDCQPSDYWLKFSNNLSVRINCGSDGYTIYSDDEFPVPFDMQESGENLTRDFTLKDYWYDVQGYRFNAYSIIYHEGDSNPMGVKMLFGDDRVLIILNYDDDFYVSDKYPDDPGPYIWIEKPAK